MWCSNESTPSSKTQFAHCLQYGPLSDGPSGASRTGDPDAALDSQVLYVYRACMRITVAAASIVVLVAACSRSGSAPEVLAPQVQPKLTATALGSASVAPSAPEISQLAAHQAIESVAKRKPITDNALPKNALCAPGGGGGAPRGTHPGHEGELFHLYAAEYEAEYRTGKAMPDGSVIVKRSFKGNVESGTTAYFLMFKKAGSNAAGGDWLYATTQPDGTLIRSGALADCAGCHNGRRTSDYLFRKYAADRAL
jgi:hypothetical protein